MANLIHIVVEYNTATNVNGEAIISCQIYHPHIHQRQDYSDIPNMLTYLLEVLLDIYLFVNYVFFVII